MTKHQDITDKRYGRLTAICMTQSTRPTKWLCQCDCGIKKHFILGDLNRGHTRSCGCLHKETSAASCAKKKKSLDSHIHGARRRIQDNSIPEPNSGCWLWLRTLDKKGYGKIGYRGEIVVASRLSYQVFVADPGNLFVLHRCDVPSCVNPDHLFVGTQQENIRDCIAKGRFRPRGVLQPKDLR